MPSADVTLYAKWKKNLSSAKEITAFNLSSNTGTISGTSITVMVPYGINVTTLKATFTVSEKATVKVGDTIQVSGTTENDFTNNVTYTVSAEDGTTKNYVVTVTVCNPDSYSISYVLDGGTWSTGYNEPTQYTIDKTTTLPTSSNIQKTGYTFDGWFTESDCSGTALTTLGAMEYTDPITLYAKWNLILFQFSSYGTFTLKTHSTKKEWDGTLEYSTDNSTWTTWDGITTLTSSSSVNADEKYTLYLRGTNNHEITGDFDKYWVLTPADTTKKIACSGNIENLLDYATVAKGNHPTMWSYCYCDMFYDCTSLTTAPDLPATTLDDYCYSYMFSGCTSLTTAPVLPATTLDNNCYSRMFNGCKNLTTPPALPATTLDSNCYEGMFYGCTSLTTIPALPATTLTNYCYNGMFNGCSLIKMSETQTEDYTNAYPIPTTTYEKALTDMFTGTGGSFTGTPDKAGHTYYTSNTIIPAN